MRMLTGLLSRLRRFRRSERGSFSVETVMIFPLLVFAVAGMYLFFDGVRTVNVNMRASYTIADMLSRETNVLDQDYIDGLNKVLRVLTQSKQDTLLRISVVRWDGANDKMVLVWSAVSGGTGVQVQPINAGTLSDISDRVPIMANGDINIVVETYAAFEPFLTFNGIDAYYFENLVVTRPRFGPQLRFDASA